MKVWTVNSIRNAKGRQKLACLTAHDYATARILDQSDIPLILVGDSLAMTVLGYETTLPVTMDQMLHHAAAVTRGVEHALVVADMPFMSYQISVGQAVKNAGRFIKEAGVMAVKIEGGRLRVPTIHALIENGIPVLAHIGLTPQSVRAMGGYKVQGRNNEEAAKLLDDALSLSDAGVFGIVLEGIPAELGAEITRRVPVPTIGIGAGPDCDGQILVTHDLLGLYSGVTPKFAKRYANLAENMQAAFSQYKVEVANSTFPGREHCY